ncbi:hypothetical protein EMIHUDRAFT_248207 [Emiliania huxleyi CCMP1516]|uniref:BTB domain-containing protein n=2 Tax=Emiliania huxleyi TaxID=2903 RepID=A0A0D3IHS8_EMIH1|nr:hypothetical protein EMIHUDRAFT_248207 [Emiliania huxleyi CCMP1516]EOD10813.1 hypothetical protein EMIHUDRAFT_248207 [Emiliania huxleyi CCMP1516]|eukprot:XP_005763242.1 hypothetical protein EMIHUDRAFT_248207 [Emiliania huxleyi CCMP1516]
MVPLYPNALTPTMPSPPPPARRASRVEVATGAVTTLAGSTYGFSDGVGGAAQFRNPLGVAISTIGSVLLVCTSDSLRQVCVSAPPPPPSFAPIVVPPSTLAADLGKVCGDPALPDGKVTVLETDLATFTALVRYLCTDQLDLGEEGGGRAQRALDLRQLAQMYQVPRLELLCAQALQESVGPASAVPLLEAAHTMGDGRLLAQCRRCVADHAAEVRASGGVEQLRDFGVAKGLLGDALD